MDPVALPFIKFFELFYCLYAFNIWFYTKIIKSFPSCLVVISVLFLVCLSFYRLYLHWCSYYSNLHLCDLWGSYLSLKIYFLYTSWVTYDRNFLFRIHCNFHFSNFIFVPLLMECLWLLLSQTQWYDYNLFYLKFCFA